MTDETETTLAGKTKAFFVKPMEALKEEMPAPRAEMKRESTTAGWLVAFVGFVMIIAGVTIAMLNALGGRDFTIATVLLISILVGVGVLVFGVGMNLISRDVSPAMDKAGLLAVNIINALKGNRGGQ